MKEIKFDISDTSIQIWWGKYHTRIYRSKNEFLERLKDNILYDTHLFNNDKPTFFKLVFRKFRKGVSMEIHSLVTQGMYLVEDEDNKFLNNLIKENK